MTAVSATEPLRLHPIHKIGIGILGLLVFSAWFAVVAGSIYAIRVFGWEGALQILEALIREIATPTHTSEIARDYMVLVQYITIFQYLIIWLLGSFILYLIFRRSSIAPLSLQVMIIFLAAARLGLEYAQIQLLLSLSQGDWHALLTPTLTRVPIALLQFATLLLIFLHIWESPRIAAVFHGNKR